MPNVREQGLALTSACKHPPPCPPQPAWQNSSKDRRHLQTSSSQGTATKPPSQPDRQNTRAPVCVSKGEKDLKVAGGIKQAWRCALSLCTLPLSLLLKTPHACIRWGL